MKRYEEAEEESRKAIQIELDNPDYYERLATAFWGMGQVIKATIMEWKAIRLRAAQQKN